MSKVPLTCALLVSLASLARAQAPSAAAQGLAPVAAASGAKVWLGRHDEVAQFLRTAPIRRLDDLPVGVTKPKRAFFEPGGLAASAAVKHLAPGIHEGFWDSYRSEIAAYELDRLLGLDMVPVTVERRVGSDLASVQLWVEDCKLLKGLDQSACPRPSEWARQVCRQRAFDNLTANIDRNAGNLLVDSEWNLILIDHSRAFASDRLPFEKELTRIDRELYARLKALDQDALMRHVRPWVLGDGAIHAILKRRDRMVARLERLVREKGEAAVFPW